jgi:hypothetical protein
MAAGRIPIACQRQQMASEVATGDRRPRRYRTGCSSGSLESVTGLVALLLGRVTLAPGAAGRPHLPLRARFRWAILPNRVR